MTIADRVRELLNASHEGTLIPGYDDSVEVTISKGSGDPITGRGMVSRYEVSEDKGNIIRGDLKILLRHSVFGEIDETCSVTFKGRSPRVLAVKPIDIAGEIYEYEVQARG